MQHILHRNHIPVGNIRKLTYMLIAALAHLAAVDLDYYSTEKSPFNRVDTHKNNTIRDKVTAYFPLKNIRKK
jgi:hypothetical protein